MSVNCHTCPFKQNIPGDCHVACGHPVVNGKNQFIVLSAVMRGSGHLLTQPLGLIFSEYGIQSGWCNFPINYDPAWLSGECKLRSHYEAAVAAKLESESSLKS